MIVQDFVRFQMTAAENIAVGQIDGRDDRPRIIAAAEASRADPMIRRRSNGYDQLAEPPLWIS